MKTLLWPLVFVSATAMAERFSFQTPYDKFDLVTGSKAGTVEGKPAPQVSYANILGMLVNPLGEECPPVKLGKAPITVTIHSETRSIYPQKGVVTDGKNCLTVAGEGLHFFPIHRDFLVGPKRGSIKLKSPLKIFRNGVKIASLKKRGSQWVNETPEPLINWDFLERFENSLNEYDVRLRVQETIKEGKAKMIVQSGDQSFEFYKITNVLWAVKRPGMKWLEASDDWSFWYDMDSGVVEDRYAAQIKIATDPTHDKDVRMSALEKMDATWSPNMREAYHKILQNAGEDPAIQSIALKRLKRKPSVESAGVMIKFIETSSDDDLKREAGVILKLQNPKGPKYDPAGSEQDKAKALEFWRNWWKQNSKES